MSTTSTKQKPQSSSKRKSAKRAKKPAARRVKKDEPQEFTAKTADRHLLYQLSVQSPEEDIRFLSRVYKRARGRAATHFREDFCGTAFLSAAWVRRGAQYSAEGFDICTETLAWGESHNLEPLGKAAERVRLHAKDVRVKSERAPDIRAAQNFSYFIFHTREEMLDYCKAAYRDLADDGIFVMDIYGGPDSLAEMEEEREIDEGFTYIWDQDSYWPATGEYNAFIHFEFEDGTRLNKAFKYEWRLWGITEIQDVLREAGFSTVETFWEGTDKDGESGNGVYRKSKRGENCEAWVTYIVGYK